MELEIKAVDMNDEEESESITANITARSKVVLIVILLLFFLLRFSWPKMSLDRAVTMMQIPV